MTYIPPERTPPAPPKQWKSEEERRAWFANRDTWPDELGSRYPSHNQNYPIMPIRWSKEHDLYFVDWLQQKRVDVTWFHHYSSYEEKRKLIWEFANIEDVQFGVRPGGGRNSNHKRIHWSERQPSLTTFGKIDPFFTIPNWVIRFIDWLNKLVGAEKPKEKTNDEQMATFEELFEGYEDDDRKRDTDHTIG